MSFPGLYSPERRGNGRHPVRTAAVLVLPDGTALRGRTLDLGTSGAGLVADVPVPLNTTVTLRMTLPSKVGEGRPFEAKATVANCSLAGSLGGFRIGVQFAPLSAAAQAALSGALP